MAIPNWTLAMMRSSNQALSTLWAISDVERETGLSKDTLRIWERRYGFPNPIRDALGERQYDSEELAKLKLIKRLLDAGHRPKQVVSLPLDELLSRSQVILESVASSLDEGQGDLAAKDPRWMVWLEQNQIDALRQGMRQYLLRHGLAMTIESLIFPLSVQVGEAWLIGRLSVYQEHLYTEVVQVLLREAMTSFEATRSEPKSPPRVVLTTLPKEKHAIGLLMAECFLTMEHCECRALGPGTPVGELVQAAVELQADVVALSFSVHSSAQEVIQNLKLLREQLPFSVEIWVGGSAPVLRTKRSAPWAITVARARDLIAEVERWRARDVQRSEVD